MGATIIIIIIIIARPPSMKRVQAWMALAALLLLAVAAAAAAAAAGRGVALRGPARREPDPLFARLAGGEGAESVARSEARPTPAAAAPAAAVAAAAERRSGLGGGEERDARTPVEVCRRQRADASEHGVERAEKDDDDDDDDGGGRAHDRKKRVMRRTPAEEEPPAPPRHDDDHEYQAREGGRISGEPTLKEMAQVLSQEAYEQYVLDWKRGKASRRMDHAIRRGYVMTADEEGQHARDHQSAVEAQKAQRYVMRILVRTKRARPATVDTFQARRRGDVGRRQRWRQRSIRELQTLRALVQAKTATAAQLDRYQAIRQERMTTDRAMRARQKEALQQAKARMAELKALIVAGRATKAQRRKYDQLEAFVQGKSATRAAQNKRYREKRAKQKAEEKEKAEEEGKDARDGSNASGPDKDGHHPLQMAGHPLLWQEVESSLRKGFRSWRQKERQTLSWLHTLRRLSPEAAPEAATARGELVLPE
ncbi:MAG: hypothetical protein M1826_000180 [Phylliscum demangeonii]|nr:MAG: hypothetical protein M1826_000180 [Phylliscum demangeonii]